MILAASIVAGVLVACVLYRVLFYDFGDFMSGLVKLFTMFLVRRSRWPRSKPPTPEDFEDESWFSGIRFFIFLALSIGGAFFTYTRLLKYFG